MRQNHSTGTSDHTRDTLNIFYSQYYLNHLRFLFVGILRYPTNCQALVIAQQPNPISVSEMDESQIKMAQNQSTTTVTNSNNRVLPNSSSHLEENVSGQSQNAIKSPAQNHADFENVFGIHTGFHKFVRTNGILDREYRLENDCQVYFE
jgi:hypothetical protein